MSTVWKASVPVDGQPHQVLLSEPILLAQCQSSVDSVEVWFESDDLQPVWLRIFGTGHPLPDERRHVASVMTGAGTLVWHLYAVEEPS